MDLVNAHKCPIKRVKKHEQLSVKYFYTNISKLIKFNFSGFIASFVESMSCEKN